MRDRVRTKGHTSKTYGFLYHGPYGSSLPSIEVIYDMPSSKMEYMYDFVGNESSDFNPCYHDKVLSAVKPVEGFVTGSAETGYMQYSFSVGALVPYPQPGVHRTFSLPIEDWLEDFSVSAEDHFKTAVQDDTLILNFILELIQLCEGNISILKKLQRTVSDMIKNFRRLYEQTGNYWLAWNFAIKPSIGDILSALNVLKRAEKRLKFLRARNHLNTKVKYREGPRVYEDVTDVCSANWPTPVPHDPPYSYTLPPDAHFEIHYDEVEVVLSSWAWVRWDIDSAYLDDWVTATGMVSMIMLGLYNPLKIIWEAIPFSWLIDWFTNKRTQLLLEQGNLGKLMFPDAEILGTGHTVSLKATGTYTFKPDLFGTNDIDAGAFQYERYDRRPGLPNPGEYGLRLGMLNAWQTSILGAIGGQRFRRR